MSVLNDDTWRAWPEEAKVRFLERLRHDVALLDAVPWLCDRPDCDGQPHPGYDGGHARADQRPPAGEWLTWLLLGGRGSGKTRTGAEWVQRAARQYGRGALIGPTSADVRDTMLEGDSGILSIARPGERPQYQPSKRRLVWPNGAQALLFSADEPDRLRGPQQAWAWADELAAWNRLDDAWSNLLMGLRLGPHPRVVCTTTPRPLPLIKSLVKDSTCHVTRATTYANLANLAPTFRAQVLSRYEGTRIGRQELLAEVLEDVEGALWSLGNIDTARVQQMPRGLQRVGVGVDPAVTSNAKSDETGIIVGGRSFDRSCPACGPVEQAHAFVWADVSGKHTPDSWARRVLAAYDDNGADVVVAEVNNGGDLVGRNLSTLAPGMRIKQVRASRGKQVRAEPVVALYEQGRVHHVGSLPALESQMTEWTPDAGFSPDRLDALVWLLTELLLEGRAVAPARNVRT